MNGRVTSQEATFRQQLGSRGLGSKVNELGKNSVHPSKNQSTCASNSENFSNLQLNKKIQLDYLLLILDNVEKISN